MDHHRSEVQPSHNRSTKGDLGYLSVWGALYYRPDEHPPSQEVVLSRFLLRTVSGAGWRFRFGFSHQSCSTLGYAAFFVAACVHTPYVVPWIFPCLAFYGLDLLFKMIRSRVKDAVLVPVGNQMTLVRIDGFYSFGSP